MAGGLSVWFDELDLRPGASLRRSIDRGLSQARIAVVVLSPSFFGKKWTEHELDGIVQHFDEGNLIPIWHNVDHAEVERYSSPLADKVAIKSSFGIPYAVQQLKSAVARYTHPTVGTAVTAPSSTDGTPSESGSSGPTVAKPAPKAILTITVGDGPRWEKRYTYSPAVVSDDHVMYVKTLIVTSLSDAEARRCRVRLKDPDPITTNLNTPRDLDWLVGNGSGGVVIDLEPYGSAQVILCRAQQYVRTSLEGHTDILAKSWEDPLGDVIEDAITVTAVAWAEGTSAVEQRIRISGLRDPNKERVYPNVVPLPAPSLRSR